jgi:hypothetical protein
MIRGDGFYQVELIFKFNTLVFQNKLDMLWRNALGEVRTSLVLKVVLQLLDQFVDLRFEILTPFQPGSMASSTPPIASPDGTMVKVFGVAGAGITPKSVVVIRAYERYLCGGDDFHWFRHNFHSSGYMEEYLYMVTWVSLRFSPTPAGMDTFL